MKRLVSLVVCSVALAAVPAHAGGHQGHGYGHGGGGGGGWFGWVAPVIIGAAVVGAAAHVAEESVMANRYPPAPNPALANTYDPTFIAGQPYIGGAPVAAVQAQPAHYSGSYCPTSNQFYPSVATCNVPWRLVSY